MDKIFKDRVLNDILKCMLYLCLIFAASRNKLEIVSTLSLYFFIILGGWMFFRIILLVFNKRKITSKTFFSKYKFYIYPLAYLALLSVLIY